MVKNKGKSAFGGEAKLYTQDVGIMKKRVKERRQRNIKSNVSLSSFGRTF